MSQDIKESQKSAHLHAVSKPARSSTIRGADPNAKSRVLDPGTTAIVAPEWTGPRDAQGIPMGATHGDTETEAQKDREFAMNRVTVRVVFDLPVATHTVVEEWARALGWTVEEAFLRYADEIITAMKLDKLGDELAGGAPGDSEPPKGP
jgi:hypothetical protein